MTPPGLTCTACGRPFRGEHAPTDRTIRTDLGLVHATGCRPLNRPAKLHLLRARHACYRAVRTLERIEDLEWMAEGGETLHGAATRLGLSEGTLRRWLERHHYALLRRLRGHRSRDERDGAA